MSLQKVLVSERLGAIFVLANKVAFSKMRDSYVGFKRLFLYLNGIS